MRQGPGSRIGLALWVAAAFLLVILGRRLLVVFLPVLAIGLLLAVLVIWAARRGLLAEPASPDETAGEAARRRERLRLLRREAEQMEATLRDLREIQVAPDDATRARWAEMELEESLAGTRLAMARERARLLQLETARWAARIEPLLRDAETRDEQALATWPAQIRILREQGLEIRGRLEADAAAVDEPAGRSALQLIEETLAELDALKAELVERRARQLSRRPAGSPAAAGREPPALARLRALLHVTRARREVKRWLAED